jgi:hypothetical protein
MSMQALAFTGSIILVAVWTYVLYKRQKNQDKKYSKKHDKKKFELMSKHFCDSHFLDY